MNRQNGSSSAQYGTLKKSVITLALSISILITLSGAWLFSMKIHTLQNVQASIPGSIRIIELTDSIKADLNKMEMNLRNYLLSSEDSFYINFNASAAALRQEAASLQKLLASSNSTMELSRQFQNLLNTRIDVLVKLANLKYNDTMLPSDITNFVNGRQDSLEQLSLITGEILNQENDQLDQHISMMMNNGISNGMIMAGAGGSIVLLLVALLLVNLTSSRQEARNKSNVSERDQLRGFVDSVNDMMAAIDPSGRYIFFNEAYQREMKSLFNLDISVGQDVDENSSSALKERIDLLELWNTNLKESAGTHYLEFNSGDQLNIYEMKSDLLSDSNTIKGSTHIIRNITHQIKEQDNLKDAYKKLNADLEQVKERNEKISLLLEMSDIILVSNGIDEFGDIIANYCAKILNFSSGVFYVIHPSKDVLEAKSCWGTVNAKADNFLVEQCWALRTGHIYNINTSDPELVCGHVKHHESSEFSYLCIPLRAQNDIYGLLYIEVSHAASGENVLSDNDRLLIHAFTELSALALANIQLKASLMHQSIRDPLTSLYNRRYLLEFLPKQIYQSERTKNTLAVMMIDADHFKQINDIYGHDAGDIVLKELSQLLLNHIRPGDLACRYGGEEFILVLYNINTENAQIRAEKLRHEVSMLTIKYGAQILDSITISIGIAIYPENGISCEKLIESADRALYLAKNSGRNKVVLSTGISAATEDKSHN